LSIAWGHIAVIGIRLAVSHLRWRRRITQRHLIYDFLHTGRASYKILRFGSQSLVVYVAC
jgi:hypothetical protein